MVSRTFSFDSFDSTLIASKCTCCRNDTVNIESRDCNRPNRAEKQNNNNKMARNFFLQQTTFNAHMNNVESSKLLEHH